MDPRAPSRILFVDDDKSLLAGLKRSLHREAWDIHLATHAEEAIEHMEEWSYDVICSDQCMPGLYGVELLSRISKQWPATYRILLTGNATLEVAIGAVNHGQVQRILCKPIQTHMLVRAINTGIRQARLERISQALLQRCLDQHAALDQAGIALHQTDQADHREFYLPQELPASINDMLPLWTDTDTIAYQDESTG